MSETTAPPPTTAPLLRPLHEPSASASASPPSPSSPLSRRMPQRTALALLLGRAAGRRGPSMLVRETAARELEERRADWGYSKPVVALDMVWNMVFVVASLVMLMLTFEERPNVPIRVWICGYGVQCLVHVVLVWAEYRRRSRGDDSNGDGSRPEADLEAGEAAEEEEVRGGRFEEGNDSNREEDAGVVLLGGSRQSSFSKRCESMNTMASFLWWMVGFYWVVSGGEQLLQDSPRLYWLAVVYLAFDVFFAIFCVVLACLIGIALCCCLPCIIAILYTVAGQEGASEADIRVLAKYRFQASYDEKLGVGAGVMVPLESGSGISTTERVLLPEDAECCICLCPYDDGAELNSLPCNHHFHTSCVVKWLKMNATCPLCKYNIVKV